MTLASYEHHVALLCHHAGCADGLAAVDDRDDLLHLLGVKAGEHVVDDVLGLLEAWVVGCYDHLVALLHGLLCHERTLALVAVAACSANGDDLSLAVEHLMDGVEHVLQSVGRVGVVDDGGESPGGLYGVQSAVHAVQRAHDHEHILWLLAQHHCSTVDSQQVADVKLADEVDANLMSVDVEIHSFEMTLNDLALEVGQRAGRVGLHRGFGVLHHHHAVLVVGVGYGERCLGQTVEERLLSVAVVLERLVVVEMVACEVGEDAAREGQSADTLLCYGV